MAMRFAAREVLVLTTEDDCSGRSNSENIDGAIRAFRGKTRFSTEGFEDVRAVLGEAIPGPGPCIVSHAPDSFGKESGNFSRIRVQEECNLMKCRSKSRAHN